MGDRMCGLPLWLWIVVGLAVGGIGGILPDLEKIFNWGARGILHYQGLWIGLGLIGLGLAIALAGRYLESRVLIVMCAWHKPMRIIGFKWGGRGITHGICKKCYEAQGGK